MRAGLRRTQLEIQTKVRTADTQGGGSTVWSTTATRWGALEMLTGQEALEMEKIIAGRHGRVRFAYDTVTAALLPTQRLKLGTRLFQVKSAINEDERNKTMLVDVTETVI